MVFYKKLTENWGLEIQLEKFKEWTNIFLMEISCTNNKIDHHGLRINLELCQFYFCFSIYNKNHAEQIGEKL